jgi:transcriptional regulator with XRE-family HTH domain
MDELTHRLAENLRALREESRYSLDEVAELSGVSKSMLRQIEREESSPSISTVWKIANGLRVPFTSLLGERAEEVEIAGFADGESLTDEDEGYRIFPLFPYESDTAFELYYFEIDHEASLRAEPHGKGSREYVLVFAGSLTMTVKGERRDIAKGRAIRFDSSNPHSYSNGKKEQVRGIMLIHYGREARKG